MHKKVKKIHFVGIGGIGMSGIAEVLLSYGYSVTGSDLKKSDLTEKLKSLGAKIYYRHARKNIGDAQVCVYSSACSMKNPEIEESLKRNIPLLQRGEMLSEILRKGFSVSVAGAHGKTTTTAMIGRIINVKGINPTVIIGGIIKGMSKNAILGKGKIFVAEADESDGTFQRIRTNIAVVTNMDREHMDYYRDFERMDDAYATFLNGVPFDGLVSLCGDDERVRNLMPRLKKRILMYGFSPHNDLTAKNIKNRGFGIAFDVYFKGKTLGKINLPVPGRYNALNALAAISVGMEMGIPFSKIAKGLKTFEGIERRLEIKGDILGATVIDDYAHHPTEITQVLETARSVWKSKRFVVVFQPHRYSRMKDLLNSFPRAFTHADMIFVTDIYSAGEKRLKSVNSPMLVKMLKRQGLRADYLGNWKGYISKVKDILKPGDIVFSLGAGDINRLYDYLSEPEKR